MPPLPWKKLACATAAASVLLASPASASDVRVDGGKLLITAGPGEANALTLDGGTYSTGGRWMIRDVQAPLTFPASVCERYTAQTIICDLQPGGVHVDLGDGADKFTVSTAAPRGQAISANGGPGDDDLSGGAYATGMTLSGADGHDQIHGSEGDDTLDGGSGNDTLVDRVGSDRLFGGDGDDTLTGDSVTSRGADVIDGGAGTDKLADTWANAATIAISMDGVANDGPPGEGDNITGIETHQSFKSATFVAGTEAVTFEVVKSGPAPSDLTGGPGSDRLRTYDYNDTIRGGAGNDSIEAGNGADTVDPGPGNDTVNTEAGPDSCNFFECRGSYGNDTVLARDGERDVIECGPGLDRVVADAIDDVAPSCETVERPAVAARPVPQPRGKAKTARCVIPKIARGTRLASARKKLKKAGCRVTTRKTRSKVRKGRVVAVKVKRGKRLRSVKVGARLAKTTSIVVIVSRGRR